MNKQSSTLIKKGIVRLTNEFINSLPERVELIENSIRDQDYSIAIDESHKLKGVAGTYGFPEITKRCYDIEHNLRQKNYQNIEAFLSELITLKDEALLKIMPE